MWSKERLEERAKVLFNSEYVSEEINLRNQCEWIKSVDLLGSKWLLVGQVKRKS